VPAGNQDRGRRLPFAELEAAGYRAVHNGQKTYNGVAILHRDEAADIVRDIPGFSDGQKRVVALTLADTRVISVYVPNGQEVGSDKYAYKLAWFAAFAQWLRAELARWPRLALAGDFNVAPEDRDVYDPEAWRECILCSTPERDALNTLLGLGLRDAFRLFDQPEKSYSWWDYRGMDFRRNRGLRIDHILLSPALAAECRSCIIDKAARKLERPSDHAPVIAETAAP
jgi:exodeoxyribonuclease-3